MRSSIPVLLAFSLSFLVPGTAARQDYTGRWNFTGTAAHANRV